MEISLIADAVSAATTHVLGFSKFLIRNHQSFSSSSSPSNILSLVLPMDVLSPPRVRSHNHRSAPRTLVRRMHRTRRKSPTEEEGMDGGDKGIFDNGDGPFGGAGSGSGGRWWNYDPCGGSDWEESPSPSYSDPAFDFVYEVLCWIVLSNCLHFSFKRFVRIVAGEVDGPSREKVPISLSSTVC